MFTGYVGLEFTFPDSGNPAKIVLQEGTRLGYVYTDCTPTNRVYDFDVDYMESILNKQGKAPKRIQYEVYLNAFHKHTDNTISKIDVKFYSLDKLVKKYSNTPYEEGDRLCYVPACRLPANYLPKVDASNQYIDEVWNAPSTQLPKGYWEFCRLLKQCDTAQNVLYPNESNLIIYSDDWVVYGDNTDAYHLGGIPWVTDELVCKAPCCNLSENNDLHELFSIEQGVRLENKFNELLYCGDGEFLYGNGLDAYNQPFYEEISGDSYITTYQLDLTHYPILQPPNDGDDIAYNFIYSQCSNHIFFSGGYFTNGAGNFTEYYLCTTEDTLDSAVVGVCCRLSR